MGVVGQSGSGKSTRRNCATPLFTEEGRILIDGYDIDKVEFTHCVARSHVPQDPLLFSGSVSDNIALTDPNASGEDIAKAAQIACAHEFIMGLHPDTALNSVNGRKPLRWSWQRLQ